jgi:FKBP-type peptidyl-prolyl cis-trans isomerase FklB
MAGSWALAVQAADQPVLKDQKQKVSYSIGVSLGNSWKNQGVEVNLDALAQGLRDALSGSQTMLTEQQMREILQAYQQELQAKQEQQRKQLGEKNKKESEAFLAENKTKPGVITQPSGLQYKVIEEGRGQSPKSNDTVTVNYRGALIDGTEFDSSYQRGQPATFAANQVIKGWAEALQLMKDGAKWKLFIPPNLAYGEAGSGRKIGPGAALVFDVELISHQSPPPPNEPVTSDIIKVPSAEEMQKGAKIEIIKKEDVPKK